MDKKIIHNIIQKLDFSFFKNDHVVIDCGHLPVYHTNENHFVFGNFLGQPSATQQITLEIGLFLFNKLKTQGKKPKISICFTDTTKFIKDIKARTNLLNIIKTESIFEILPENYKSAIEEYAVNNTDFIFSLQTRNSNKFLNKVKAAKENIKKATYDTNDIFNQYKAIFIEDCKENEFGFVNPFTLTYKAEDEALGGDWWRDKDYQLVAGDLLLAPFIRVKKLGIIKLFSKSEGVLCPATYAGLLLNFDNNCDHIAVYSRTDDAFVAEKIIRGITSNYVLTKGFKRNCAQVILQEHTHQIEYSYISEDVIKDNETFFDFDGFFELFKKSDLIDKYKLYI